MAAAKERTLGATDKKRLSELLTDAMSGRAGLLALVPGSAHSLASHAHEQAVRRRNEDEARRMQVRPRPNLTAA